MRNEHKLRLARADLALPVFALVYFADLLTLDAHFDRYVLPLVPVLGVLAGRIRALAPVALCLLVVPLAWSVGDVRELTRTDTRLVAHRWLEENLPTAARIAVDPSTAPVEAARVLKLELPGPGRPTDPNRDLARLRARGIGYVLATGAVADRVLAARARYPAEARFYDDLERSAEPLFRIEAGDGRAGPWVAVYRL